MQRVIILSPAHPLRGGIASSTERLAQELQQQGSEVTILSFSLQYPKLLFPGKTQYTTDPAPKELDIRPVINSINPLNWLKVGRQLAQLQPDLIISRFWLPFMGPALGTILRTAKKRTQAISIGITDNVIPHEQRPGDKALTRYYLGGCDGFIVMSKSVEEDIRKFTSLQPVAYTPHPIYDNYGPISGRKAALQQLGLPARQRYLLFFGFIREYKGLDLLLQAMALPQVRSLGLQLIVAGEFYGPEAPYRQMVEGLGIAEAVVFRSSYIPKEEVGLYFAAADLVVQPYKTATQSGISQLAFHFEKPMVVTDVGGLPEIVRHGEEGYVVPISPEAIANAISDFYAHGRETDMTKAVRAGKARFDWSHMASKIREMYQQLKNPNS